MGKVVGSWWQSWVRSQCRQLVVTLDRVVKEDWTLDLDGEETSYLKIQKRPFQLRDCKGRGWVAEWTPQFEKGGQCGQRASVSISVGPPAALPAVSPSLISGIQRRLGCMWAMINPSSSLGLGAPSRGILKDVHDPGWLPNMPGWEVAWKMGHLCFWVLKILSAISKESIGSNHLSSTWGSESPFWEFSSRFQQCGLSLNLGNVHR